MEKIYHSVKKMNFLHYSKIRGRQVSYFEKAKENNLHFHFLNPIFVLASQISLDICQHFFQFINPTLTLVSYVIDSWILVVDILFPYPQLFFYINPVKCAPLKKEAFHEVIYFNYYLYLNSHIFF